jgi:hypothetical protein
MPLDTRRVLIPTRLLVAMPELVLLVRFGIEA